MTPENARAATKRRKEPTARAPRGETRYVPEQTFGFVLWDTARAFMREFAARISRHGINFGDWPFLRALWEEDGLTQRELSDRVRLKGPTAVAVLARLERKGLVRRVRNAHDVRKMNVFLTAAGRAMYDRIAPEIREVNLVAGRGLTEAEMQDIVRLLKHARRNVLDLDR